MFLIALSGLLLAVLGTLMVLSPENWSKGIITFSQKPYFHGFELLSRLVIGIIYLYYAEQTLEPFLMEVIGYVHFIGAVVILIIFPTRHKQFAIWSATRFKSTFRPMGVAAILFGVYIIYAALGAAF